MAKPELFNNQLIPWVLIASVLSGGLWRAAPAPDAGKPGDPGASAERADGVSGPLPWVSDLRPVMQSLDDTLGRAADGANGAERSLVARRAQPKGHARDTQIVQAMATFRTGLDRLINPTDPRCGEVTALQATAATLGAWMLDPRQQRQAAGNCSEGTARPYRDWLLLEELASRMQPDPRDTGAPTYAVDFIVATVPDYVDSNSGWLADQNLAALQSGMVEKQFLFDRVKLVDWSRSQAGSACVVASSRLHERQPGVIIFRRVEDKTVQISPSRADRARDADRRSAPGGAAQQPPVPPRLGRVRETHSLPFRVLGPNFSGSTLSLASVIGEAPPRCLRPADCHLRIRDGGRKHPADEGVQPRCDLSRNSAADRGPADADGDIPDVDQPGVEGRSRRRAAHRKQHGVWPQRG